MPQASAPAKADDDPERHAILPYAHTLPGAPPERWELLADHAREVARRAGECAALFGWRGAGQALGQLHDAGKASREFQSYLRGERGSIDHSTAGARAAIALYPRPLARMLALCIAGHHAGLADPEDLDRRLSPERHPIPHADWAGSLDPPEVDTLRPSRRSNPAPRESRAFGRAFLARMLFSCLVDADFLATEAFMRGGEVTRGIAIPLERLRDRLTSFMEVLRADAKDTPLNRLRAEILEHAKGKAGDTPGLFTLTVPTGGGKTLASLSFALDHALCHGKRRVIYVIPFTSIIEQTAAVFRAAIGKEAVLEHHSSFDWETAARQAGADGGDEHDHLGVLRRAAENWDAPVVVTTSVQFFESLFANRTSACRKLHNLVDSVIVLDEAQMLPMHLLLPCLAALDELRRNYGASVVLCTATQPALRRQDGALQDGNGTPLGLDIPGERELAPRPAALYAALRRVRVENLTGETADESIADRFAAAPQMLCIVNNRAHARALFDRIADMPGAAHLTTLMCPAHRRQVLATLRARLAAGEPVRLVATSLIEAGVDIDFPEVWRATAGIDSIAQAAGRCNREGCLAGLGRVVVFTPAEAKPPRSLRVAEQVGQAVLRDHVEDPLALDAVHAFFHLLYFRKGAEALDAAMVKDLRGVLPALRENARDVRFPFASIAAAFKVIDETMTPVIVPWNTAAEEALRLVETAERPPREAFRTLQQFTVGIPRRARDEWLATGVLRRVRASLGDALLRFEDLSLYQPETGLDLRNPSFRAAESNLI